MRTGATRVRQDVVYRKTERALRAFLDRDPLATLYEAATELFPLPEEQAQPRLRKERDSA
jgi:hypothetical protein